MKTAKSSMPDGSSGTVRRSQPVRQTRTNPPRTTALSRNHALPSGAGQEQSIDIFPALTHFADAITALPKELIRHFTLLKEVDAKIFAPEETLFKLIDAALNAPLPPDPARSHNDSTSSIAPSAAPNSAPMSAQNSSNGVASGLTPRFPTSSTDEPINASLFDPSNLPRRQLFRQTAYKIQDMLVSLEEKNHVISTANDALEKQLGRIEDLWPHLEMEFSEEAKWGSEAHWAYLENRASRASHTQAERSRREGAATLSAAAQQLAEEAAARSSDRKQALATKKNSRNHAADSEGDGRHQEHSRKSQGTKSGKVGADAAAAVGLGISANSSARSNPPSKRRKVDSKANGGPSTTDRALGGVLAPNASKARTASPRGTPAPDGASKKRKALPTSSSQSKKSRTGATISPSVTSSPVLGNLPEPARPGRGSPAPSANVRPTTSRARQNSTQSSHENGRQRPASSASNKPSGGVVGGTAEVVAQNNGGRPGNDNKVQNDSSSTSVPEAVKDEGEPQAAASSTPVLGGGEESTPKDVEEKEAGGSATPTAQPQAASTVTTKSGRASKPSTPALPTLAEAATVRSRPSRASESSGNPPVKRSHKKGASTAAAAAAVSAMAVVPQPAVAGERRAPQDEEDEADEAEVDGDDLRYCYCNNVSYGEMVACDASNCKWEWFHLECVGLKVAPKGAKWYCEDCRKRLRIGGKALNGR